jgi:hypothetical protein
MPRVKGDATAIYQTMGCQLCYTVSGEPGVRRPMSSTTPDGAPESEAGTRHGDILWHMFLCKRKEIDANKHVLSAVCN